MDAAGGNTTTIQAALAQLRSTLGAEHVVSGQAAITAWAQPTHPARTLPTAVLHTSTAMDVAAVMRCAAATCLRVAVTSRGQNIGLGHRLPPDAAPFVGQPWIAIDLSAHDGIGALDARDGTISLEPGVSFAQLHARLRSQAARWYMPAIGGPPEASVLANALQRGDGTGPGGGAARLLELEAVLPGGEILCLRRGLAGPDLFGLFEQSSFGVVTRATVALQPLPELMTVFVLAIPGAALADSVDALRTCLRDGILAPGACALWNAAKLQTRDGAPPALAGDAWAISGALHAASAARADADWDDFVARLGVGSRGIELLALERQRPSGEGLFQGEPTRANLAAVRAGVASAEGEPGFAWLCPLLPFNGAAVIEYERLARSVLEPAGLIVSLAAACIDFRSLRGFVAIAWDRTDAVMERRAMAAHNALFALFTAAGMSAFRIGHLATDWAPQGQALIQALRGHLVISDTTLLRPTGR